MYKVINWDDGQVMATFDDLKQAIKWCHGQGTTGKMNGCYYLPVSFVADEQGCVFNPFYPNRVNAVALEHISGVMYTQQKQCSSNSLRWQRIQGWRQTIQVAIELPTRARMHKANQAVAEYRAMRLADPDKGASDGELGA